MKHRSLVYIALGVVYVINFIFNRNLPNNSRLILTTIGCRRFQVESYNVATSALMMLKIYCFVSETV